MDSLDFSTLSGSLVVKKNITGDVAISTVPPIVISDMNPKVVAIGPGNVRKAIKETNVRELVRKRILLVVC